MSNIYTAAEQLIGHTPLLRLVRVEAAHNLNCRLLVKLESVNPGGSAKDRVARAMLDDAEDRGLIGPGATIIEPTSGNTGIGLAAVCAQRGYRCIIVMPDSMSAERQKLMTAYGAELVLTPGSGGILASIAKAKALAASIPGSYIPDQFSNPANAAAHYMTTGPEIWADSDGEVDIFVRRGHRRHHHRHRQIPEGAPGRADHRRGAQVLSPALRRKIRHPRDPGHRCQFPSRHPGHRTV